MNVDALKRQREKLLKEAEGIVETASAEERVLTSEERESYDSLVEQIDAVDGDIKRAEKYAQLTDDQRNVAVKDMANVQVNEPEPKFASFGEQLQAVARFATSNGQDYDQRLQSRATGASETVGSEGGFLVQPEFADDLFKLAHDTGILPDRCRPFTLSQGNKITINGVDETSRANGSRWGGIQGYWEGEADTLSGSKPAFREINLQLRKLTGLAYATDELIEDAAMLESVIQQGFAEEMGFKLDDAIVNGDGVGKPLGIMNAGSLVSVDKETNQDATTLVYDNVVKMWSRLWPRSQRNAVWYVNSDVQPQLFTMGLSVGTGGSPVYLPPGGASVEPYGSLFGRPVIPIEQCQTLGTKGDVVLADLSQYALARKRDVKADSSIHVQFTTDEMTYRFILRVDGQPMWESALTPFKGSNTQSPFVTLKAR